ncbi:MAG TPA: hypothetical protein VFJ16_21310 [Longimicrobium sp.]|nr:hypothetical protein [Longimicrobium sp.]
MRFLYFGAQWCNACHDGLPAARQTAASLGIPLEEIDIDTEGGQERADALGARALPALLLLDGDRVRFRLMGAMISPENAGQLASVTLADLEALAAARPF